jgi:CheY-like chemotaxis protein
LRKYILLVEDNPDDQFMVKRALRSYPEVGLEIATDGQEALDFLEAAGHEVPALVLLDLKMPKVSGIEVLRWLRSTEPFTMIPVVVFSSSDELSDIAAIREFGATDYVQKPVDFDEYAATVQELAGRYANT